MITISTDENGGSLDYFNQTGENAISLTVGLDGSGLVDRILKDSSDSKGSVNKNSGSFKDIVKCRLDDKIVGTWRARTMAKLSEMGKIEWSIEKKTSKPQYKIKEEPTLKLRKKKVVQTSKSK